MSPPAIAGPARIGRRDVLVALAYAACVLSLQLIAVRTSGLLDMSAVGRRPLVVVALLVAAAATLWRRRRPILTLAVTGSLSAAAVVLDGRIAAYLLLFEALWSPIVHGSRRLAQATTGIGGALSAVFVVLLVSQLGWGDGLATGLLIVLVVVGTPLLWGWDVRLHRTAQRTAEALAASERALAQERAGRAVEQERREIAQDLHDLVAGHLSAVSLHAGLARSLPDEAARDRSLATAQDSARAALRDLRAMIGLLTANGETAAPGETLSWTALADRLQVGGGIPEDGGTAASSPAAAGAPAVVSSPAAVDAPAVASSQPAAGAQAAEIAIDPAIDDPARVDPVIRAALLRSGAEAVANALRHGEAPRTLEVRLDDAEAVLICTNTIIPGTAPGSGLGLPALRHRTRALDGTATAGPDPADPARWRLEMRLPAAGRMLP